MFNRYVDGLATTAPVDAPDFYKMRAAGVVANGYAANDPK